MIVENGMVAGADEELARKEQWWEDMDKAYQMEEENVILHMKMPDYLEAVECMSKIRHQELWNAMRDEDIQEMREVMLNVFKDYASMIAHQNVDKTPR